MKLGCLSAKIITDRWLWGSLLKPNCSLVMIFANKCPISHLLAAHLAYCLVLGPFSGHCETSWRLVHSSSFYIDSTLIPQGERKRIWDNFPVYLSDKPWLQVWCVLHCTFAHKIGGQYHESPSNGRYYEVKRLVVIGVIVCVKLYWS